MFNKYLSCNKIDCTIKDENNLSSEENLSDYDDIKYKIYYCGEIGTEYNNKNRLILETNFNVDDRYQILKCIGKGAFSDVYKSKDYKNNSIVALKVVRNEKRFHRCAYNENKLYEKLQEKSICINIINLQRFFKFNNDLFFIFEIHGISLYDYYRDYENKIYMKDFSRQILNGLVYLHNFNIIHADLKPENILIKDNILKIIDLGSSFDEKQNIYEDYIQSRWYRSPEVLFNKVITKKIDIWSYGCIVYELYHRKPLFKGKDSEDMRNKIHNLIYSLNYNNFLFVENNFLLDSIINLCLKFNSNERLSSEKLIKNIYFKPEIYI
jgi:serine/threonine protein kinase